MFVDIAESIKIKNPSMDVVWYCKDNLIFDNPDYKSAERMGRWLGNIPETISLYAMDGDVMTVPFGCLEDIWHLCKKAVFKAHFGKVRNNNLKGQLKLYDYQTKALNALIGGKNGVLEAPCGSGKTQIGLALIKEIGGKALWLTHTKKLLTQSMDRAKSMFGESDYGTITEGKVNIGSSITFATVQTMSRIDPNVYRDSFDIVVVDECHHCVGSPTKVTQFYKVLSNCRCRYKYGLSATLNRADGLEGAVYAILGKKLYTITKEEVGSKIIKAKHVGIDTHVHYDVCDYSGPDGMIDYGKMITTISENRERQALICHVAKQFKDVGKRQLILCSRVNQAKDLATMLGASLIIGSKRNKDRDFDAKTIVATYALAKEGLDIPDLDVVHFASPIKDEAAVRQSAGRVERFHEGKDTPIIVDYVDEEIPYCVRAYRIRRRILKKY